jgi:hypothetical protein
MDGKPGTVCAIILPFDLRAAKVEGRLFVGANEIVRRQVFG